MVKKLLLIFVAVCSAIACLSLNALAQSFETLDQAAADPFVVQLVGKDKIDFFRKTELAKAAENRVQWDGVETQDLFLDARSKIVDHGMSFVKRILEESEQATPFDAHQFLVVLEKLELVQSRMPDSPYVSNLSVALNELSYTLSLDHRVYEWKVYSGHSVPQSPGIKKIVESDLFIVPFVLTNYLDSEVNDAYRSCYQAIIRKFELAGGDLRSELTSGRIAQLRSQAKAEALKWYEQKESELARSFDQQTIDFRKQWFNEYVEPDIYDQARVTIIRLASKANQYANNAASGLKYTRINAEKALAAANSGDSPNAKSYFDSANESALEGFSAASELAETLGKMKKARKYMIRKAARDTELEQIANMSNEQLMAAHDARPRGGHNSAIRNIIKMFVDLNEAIEKVSGQLVEANNQADETKPILQACEQKIRATMEAQRDAATKAAQKTFDVSSRQAFDTSMSELAQTLEPSDQVKFYQKWGKLVQEAVGKNPAMMANDEDYMKFIRDNFEGKTAVEFAKD